MNNDLFMHANGLIKRFRQEAEKASEHKNWTAAQTWFNAVSIVEEPETNVEILKQFPTAKLPPTVCVMRRTQGKWVWKPDKRCWECDQCGETTTESVMCKPRFRFCPGCGADMTEDNAWKLSIEGGTEGQQNE